MIRCAFGDQLLVPNTGGIYLFADLRGVLYVGRSEDLRRRYREHRLGETNRHLLELMARPAGVLRFGWVRAESAVLGVYERALIRFLRPPANRIRYSRTG